MAIRLQRRKKESKEEFIQRVYDTFEKGKASNKEQDDRADSYFEKWYSDSLKDNESTDGPLQFIGDWMEKASQSLGIESTKDRVGDMVESVSGLFRQEVELKLNDVSELKTEDAIKLRDEYGLKKVIIPIDFLYDESSYSYDIDTYIAIRKEIDEIVNSVELPPEGHPNREKLIFAQVAQNLANRIEYDFDAVSTANPPTVKRNAASNLEGGFLNGLSICAGYSVCLPAVLTCLDVDSKTISGYKFDISSGHAWNQVCLDGDWYHTDLTWDDTCLDEGFPLEYTLRSDDTFKNHDEFSTYRSKEEECHTDLTEEEMKVLFYECQQDLAILVQQEGETAEQFKNRIKTNLENRLSTKTLYIQAKEPIGRIDFSDFATDKLETITLQNINIDNASFSKLLQEQKNIKDITLCGGQINDIRQLDTISNASTTIQFYGCSFPNNTLEELMSACQKHHCILSGTTGPYESKVAEKANILNDYTSDSLKEYYQNRFLHYYSQALNGNSNIPLQAFAMLSQCEEIDWKGKTIDMDTNDYLAHQESYDELFQKLAGESTIGIYPSQIEALKDALPEEFHYQLNISSFDDWIAYDHLLENGSFPEILLGSQEVFSLTMQSKDYYSLTGEKDASDQDWIDQMVSRYEGDLENKVILLDNMSELSAERAKELQAMGLKGIVIQDGEKLHPYEIDTFIACQDKIKELVSQVKDPGKEDSNGEKMIFGQAMKNLADRLVYDEDAKGEEKVKRYLVSKDHRGGLLEGKSTEEGYALIAKDYLTALGLDARIVHGQVRKETNGKETMEDHTWNQVKIDGNWYHFDLTRDDEENLSKENPVEYMLQSDAQFAEKGYVLTEEAKACTTELNQREINELLYQDYSSFSQGIDTKEALNYLYSQCTIDESGMRNARDLLAKLMGKEQSQNRDNRPGQRWTFEK